MRDKILSGNGLTRSNTGVLPGSTVTMTPEGPQINLILAIGMKFRIMIADRNGFTDEMIRAMQIDLEAEIKKRGMKL